MGRGEAVRIATGAPVPAGADTIVPIENSDADEDAVRMFAGLARGRHVRPAGEDVAAGRCSSAGRRLAAPELGLLANAGHAPASSTRGREWSCSPPATSWSTRRGAATFGQIRDSNSYTLFGALREAGACPCSAGIVRDDVEPLREAVLGLGVRADASSPPAASRSASATW